MRISPNEFTIGWSRPGAATEDPISETTSHPPGTFCFAELAAADRASASAFYGGLFGWEVVGVPPVPEAGYFLLKHGGKDVAGMYQLTEKLRSTGARPSWTPYVSVALVDESAERVRRLGGEVSAGPFDVESVGRMAMIRDPQGATLALWQPRGKAGYSLAGEVGSVCWNELATRDVKGAAAFYGGLFGWVADTKPRGKGSITEWRLGRAVAGGMLEMTSEWWEAVPPHWMTYVAVDDCDFSAQVARELGGKVCVPPSDIPNVGRYAVLDDPGGATFSIFTPKLTA